MCAHRKKKLNRRRAKETETSWDGDGGGDGKTVPSNSADSWVSEIEGIQTL
jgi:hypothetical protein